MSIHPLFNVFENVRESNLLALFFQAFLAIASAIVIGFIALAAWHRLLYYYHQQRLNAKGSMIPEVGPFYHLRLMKVIPAAYIIHQILCGLCKDFDKERIFRVWILHRPFVFFFKPETVEVILRSTETIEKSSEYNVLHPWLGTGILTSTGGKWLSQRKLMTPFFHFRFLKDFLPVFEEHTRVLVEKLKNLTVEPWLDVVPIITMCTLDIICETSMGLKINTQSGEYSEYAKAICIIGNIILYRLLRPWLWIDSIFFCTQVGRQFKANVQLVLDFSENVIREKKSTMLEILSKANEVKSDINVCSRRSKVLLEQLLEHHLKDTSFTEEDIRQEMNTIIFAGHDTTAVTISWTLYNLGLHPDIQDNVQNELDSIFEGDISKPITWENLSEMKYLEYTIQETLRLFPTVPVFIREIRKDTTVDKFTVPAGSAAVIFPVMLHRDSKLFPNPEKFDPERFSPENCNGRHPYAYLPFSAGPRNCMGQKYAILEIKTVVSTILRNFRVKSMDTRDKVKLEYGVVLRNVDPLMIRFTPRF